MFTRYNVGRIPRDKQCLYNKEYAGVSSKWDHRPLLNSKPDHLYKMNMSPTVYIMPDVHICRQLQFFAQPPTSCELIYHKCWSLFDNFDDTTHQLVISVCLWKVQACLEKSKMKAFFFKTPAPVASFDLRFCAVLAAKHEVGFGPFTWTSVAWLQFNGLK